MKLFATALTLATLAAFTPAAHAAPVGKARLAGHWTATIVGTTGCGFSTMHSTFTLGEGGNGNATTVTHSAGCGDFTATNPFNVLTLASTGAGTAHLSCGANCGWNLLIQVLPGNKLFNLVDVDAENPNNFIEGTAVHQ